MLLAYSIILLYSKLFVLKWKCSKIISTTKMQDTVIHCKDEQMKMQESSADLFLVIIKFHSIKILSLF